MVMIQRTTAVEKEALVKSGGGGRGSSSSSSVHDFHSFRLTQPFPVRMGKEEEDEEMERGSPSSTPSMSLGEIQSKR